MAAGIPRYIVERGPDDLKTAFTGIVRLCEEHSIQHVTLVVPTKGHFSPGSVLADFLGPAITKALLKGGAVPLTSVNGGPVMTLQSPQTLSKNVRQGMLVGVHLSADAQGKVDDVWDARVVIYLPWTEKEGREWLATWHPKTIGPSTWTVPASTITPPVEAALSSLTQNINLGSGLGHPSDKAAAVRMIGQLRAAGHSFDPSDIKRWALRHGWSSNAASTLEVLARK